MTPKTDADGKRTGWRFCVDFRRINQETIKDVYPLPRITELLHSVKQSRYFVALDLRSGYWQIPMERDSIKYTAFRCLYGLYEFVVMPFGLTNAPATFQRLVDLLFSDKRYDGVLAYIDDILIHDQTFEGVMGKLAVVLDRLMAEGLTINFAKSSFFPSVLKYIGHTITDGCLKPNTHKVDSLRQFKAPTNTYEVRRLLGMIGYYHPYIKDYAGIMAPVFQLLKNTPNKKQKNRQTPVAWGDEHTKAMQEAIRLLEDSMLTLPLDSDTFMMETDASGASVAAVLNCLQQNGKWAPVEFASKKLTDTEKRWPVRDQEALAIIFGLKKFDCYLRGRSFQVLTDHKSLKWMMTAKEGRVARWASRLTEYDMTISHKSGKDMEHVDYLTRFVDTGADFDIEDRMVCCSHQVIAVENPLPTLQHILEEQQKQTPPSGKGFFTKGGVWYYHNAIWVPLPLQLSVIRACHSVAPYRHHGIKKTARLVQKVFNWPGLYHQAGRYVGSCLYCQQRRGGTERLQGYFRIHPIVGPFQTVYIDFWQCSYGGQDYKLFTMIDQFTKWVECIPVPCAQAPVVATTFLQSWVCRFGVPSTIMCDNDLALNSNTFRTLTKSLGSRQLTITPYHPEGNAVVESFHRTLKKGLTNFISPDNTATLSFEEALALVLFAYRATIHSTTGDSPAFLLYGMDMRSPMENDWRFQRDKPMQERLRFLNEFRLEVQWKAHLQRIKNIEATNCHRIPKEFQLYQLVLVRLTLRDRWQYAHIQGETKQKLIPKWSLPYRVWKVLSQGKSAIVRSLLSADQQVVHLQDVRFLEAPQLEAQREEWTEVINRTCESMFEPEVRQRKLQEFWENLAHPEQLDHLQANPRIKRMRPDALRS